MKAFFLTTALLLGSLFLQLNAQNNEPDLQEFIKETQNTKSESGEITIAWWLPVEFWEIAYKRDKNMSAETASEIVSTLKPYVIIAVVDGKISPFGTMKYSSKEMLDTTIELISADSISYAPYASESVPEDMQFLLGILSPMIKNMIGQMGENLHFYVFPDMQNKDERIFDPLKKGNITLKFNGKTRTWKTPLVTLLPFKYCPADNEPMQGDWQYCPYHGTELKE